MKGKNSMQTQERIALIIAAVERVAASPLGEGGFAILIDTDQEENYVQFVKGNARDPDGRGLLEVTSRDPDYGGSLPPLSKEQAQGLALLGFRLPANPNYKQDIDMRNPEAIAYICERAFAILGSPPTFNLKIEFGNLD